MGTHCSQNKGLSLLAGERLKSAWQLDSVLAELMVATVRYFFEAGFSVDVIGGASLSAPSRRPAPIMAARENAHGIALNIVTTRLKSAALQSDTVECSNELHVFRGRRNSAAPFLLEVVA